MPPVKNPPENSGAARKKPACWVSTGHARVSISLSLIEAQDWVILPWGCAGIKGCGAVSWGRAGIRLRLNLCMGWREGIFRCAAFAVAQAGNGLGGSGAWGRAHCIPAVLLSPSLKRDNGHAVVFGVGGTGRGLAWIRLRLNPSMGGGGGVG